MDSLRSKIPLTYDPLGREVPSGMLRDRYPGQPHNSNKYRPFLKLTSYGDETLYDVPLYGYNATLALFRIHCDKLYAMLEVKLAFFQGYFYGKFK